MDRARDRVSHRVRDRVMDRVRDRVGDYVRDFVMNGQGKVWDGELDNKTFGLNVCI